MDFIYLGIGLAVGLLIGYLIAKLSGKSAPAQDDRARIVAEERATLLAADKAKLEAELTTVRESLLTAEKRLAKAEEVFVAQDARLKEQKQYLEELQGRMKTEFAVLASEVMQKNQQQLSAEQRDKLRLVLEPLGEKITAFEKKLDQNREQGISLREQIVHLSTLNETMRDEAANLTRALKGESKTQGNWGEVILERVLERSGLVKDREYKVQVSTSGQEGQRLQPDVVVMLPEGKHLIVDAKVSLTAYEQAMREEDADMRIKLLKQHTDSIRGHIKSLSEKNYHRADGLNSPEFVLQFLPIESAFSTALQADPDLFSYAWDKRIVLVSPTTLLATLQTVASIWRQEKQHQNAQVIAERAGALYDKFVGFLETFQQIGQRLDQGQKAYEDAMRKLSEGPGNLIRRAEQMRALGAKTNKSIAEAAPGLLEEDISDDEED